MKRMNHGVIEIMDLCKRAVHHYSAFLDEKVGVSDIVKADWLILIGLK